MPKDAPPKPERSKAENSGSTIKTTIITVIGSVLVAGLTTLGTIASNSKGIQANADRLSESGAQIKALDAKAQTLKAGGLPVGTVIASLLTVPEFAKASGDPENFDVRTSQWTLADGKAVPGTAWATIRGNAPVPDLSGVFLRGKKNFDKREDLKGVDELALGEYHGDTVGPHQHDVQLQNKGEEGGGLLYNGGGTRTYGHTDLVAAWPGSETQPKNVTVNYYIKIN